jgi:hypothetical protein
LEEVLENNADRAHAPKATGQKGRDGQILVTAQATRQAMPKLAPTSMAIAVMYTRRVVMVIKEKEGAIARPKMIRRDQKRSEELSELSFCQTEA